MTYVLVSLVGDDATKDADRFARWFAERRPPAVAYHEPNPSHAAVRDAVRATPAAIVFAHDGGGSVRAIKGGTPWADARQFNAKALHAAALGGLPRGRAAVGLALPISRAMETLRVLP